LLLTCAPAFAAKPGSSAAQSVSAQKDLEFIIPQ
jgi:hypothetical protein